MPRALAVDFASVLGAWEAGSLRDRDVADGAAVRNARMGDVTVPLVVSILHPSLRGPNLRHRKFAGHEGAAEQLLLSMVRDVVRQHWWEGAPSDSAPCRRSRVDPQGKSRRVGQIAAPLAVHPTNWILRLHTNGLTDKLVSNIRRHCAHECPPVLSLALDAVKTAKVADDTLVHW